jgi:hypothetical protein
MLPTGRQAVAMFVALIFLSPGVGACSSTQHVPFECGVPLMRATGVTMRSGEDVRFIAPGASIKNDTLYAVGHTGQLMIPTDSIATVSKREFSPIRTVGLVGGLFAGVLLVALIGVASSGLNISP